ncbi:MAG: NADH:ubiquinone reductase (Na(+)-transporting) subunit A [Parachlamydiales bacterium]
MHIKTRRGLDIPLEGAAEPALHPFPATDRIALDLTPFGPIRWKGLVKEGEAIRLGEPLVYDKEEESLKLLSPAGGKVVEIRKGEKMRLTTLVIERDREEAVFEHARLAPERATLEAFAERGLFGHIRSRPFGLIARPDKPPRAIFIQALESAPFVPPSDLQVKGHEEPFQAGVRALAEIAPVHLVCREGTFTGVEGAQRHTAEGPHPIASPSLHIAKIAPIGSVKEVVWTLRAHDVVAIGTLLTTGRPHTERVISLAGMGFERRHHLRVRNGVALTEFVPKPGARLISGDPLTGTRVGPEDFLGTDHFSLCAIPQDERRPWFYFLRPSFGRYTSYRTYPSLRGPYNLSTRKHGEERPFVDGTVYDRVMPLPIPTMPLVKAVMAGEWEKAEEYGLLSVVPEDFALATFVCPSKIEMVEAIERGLDRYRGELL